jgi:hypothetical protein
MSTTNATTLEPSRSICALLLQPIKGWMVASWDDPENAPMHLPDGRIVLLQNDGKITDLKEGTL